MKKNIGQTDRIIRFVLGAVLIALRFLGTLSGTAGLIALIAGIVLIVTAFINFCPIWALLKINTSLSQPPVNQVTLTYNLSVTSL
jgi:flagellar biosynthesis protein FliP